jgi:tetratricopeptide (TPR) repeat protein
MKELEPLVSKFEIDTTENDAYNFYRAKFFLEEGNLGQVEDALLFVPEKSKYFGDAMLVSSIYNYRRGKIDDSIHDLEKLTKVIDKYDRLQGIAAITLARNYFQKGMYKEASSAYLKVNKADPLWLQAMVEQAWTQILIGDYEGAAGNMFTLHTDFFKNAFAPESYVVRTVGYLNLCQFGDGMQVLSNLHHKYDPFKEKLDSYKMKSKESVAYYNTVRNWFKNTDQKEVDGLPRNFIVELARHPSFMNIQTQINNFEDELEGFNKATLTIIQREKILIKKQADAKEELAKLQKVTKGTKITAQNKVDMEFQEKRLASYKIQYQLTNRARALIKELREKAIVRVEKEKVGLRDLAGRALKQRFEGLVADLKRVLDQNDVLQYELYSGAGEHLRYQMAGGDTKDKDAVANKKADDKKVSWKFKGEIWEDEVGHFRSSLQNVCPKEDAVAQK